MAPNKTFAAGIAAPNSAADASAYRTAAWYMARCYRGDDARQGRRRQAMAGRGTARDPIKRVAQAPPVTISASRRTRSISLQLFGIAAVIEIQGVINIALPAEGLVIVV